MTRSHLRSCFLLACSMAVLLTSGAGCSNELRKARHLSKGNREFEAGHYGLAEVEYLNVLKAAPMNPVAVRQLGIIYQEEGNLFKARYALTKAVQLEPDNVDVRVKLALNAVAIGNHKQAIEEANWVLAKKPGQLEALEVLTGTATNSAAVQALIEHIEKLRKSDTDRASYHVALGDLALRAGSVTNAETEFKQAIALDPRCSSAFGGLGGIQLSRKDLAAAESSLKSAADLSPVRSFRRLKYAEFQLLSGKVEDGKRTLEQVSKEAPDYLPVWNYLAQLAFTEKRYDDCLVVVQRVLRQDSVNYDALMLNGTARLAKGDTAKAISEFDNMAKGYYGRSPQVQFQLARAYLMTNDTAKATACLEKAVTLDKNFIDAVLTLSELKISKGNADQVIPSLTELVKKQPQLSQAHLLLAEAYFAKKDVDQAVAVCRNMAEVFPKSPEVPMLIGALFVRQDKPDEARQSFEKALELSPDYFAAIEQLVNLDVRQQKYEAAAARVQAQMDKNPKAAELWILMAEIYRAQANDDVEAENKKRAAGSPVLRLADVPSELPQVSKAEAALQKAIELNPHGRTPFLMLADLYLAEGKPQQALESLNGLLAKTNDVMAWMQIGIIQDGLKNYTAARDAYEKVLVASPNYSPALNNLAFLYCERFKDLDKAYQMADKARQLLPFNPSAADTLGWVLYRRGEYSRALGLLEESVSKLPGEPEVQFHLGMTQYMLGKEGAARLALQKAVQSTRQFDGKEQAAGCLALLAIDPKTADAVAIAALQKQLQENPRDPIALNRMGAIQERDRAFDKAADTYETALKANPRDAALTAKLAQLYANYLNDPQKAFELAKSAHDLAPDDASISDLLGRLVLRRDPKWATSLLEDSARKLPSDPQVAFDLAWAYYSLGRVSEAQNLMLKAANAGAGFAKSDEASRFLAMVSGARDMASASAAVPQAQKILNSDKNYVPALMILAIALEGQGQADLAIGTYNQVLSQFPMFAPALRNLGLLLFARTGDDQKPYDLLTKAREAFPQDPDVAKALGILTFRKGNYASAMQLLQQSAQTRKQDAELFYYLGKAQYELKSKSESKASLQQALAFNLPTKLAEDAKRVLLELK